MPKHIARLILVIVAFGAVAWFVRSLLVVDSFYEFGHYRGDSVVQIAALEPVFQTSRYCESCHEQRVAQWSSQSHKTVTCEVCHGAAAGHPASGKLPIPGDTVALCSLCHEAMTGRPRTQPQVDVAAHSAGAQCIGCHNPHAPKIMPAAAHVAGDANAGRKRAADCAGCHGERGVSGNDEWPSLAGQNAAYLARILGAYKSGDQHDVTMTPIAKDLTDADVQNLATYYAGLACVASGDAIGGDPLAGKALAGNCAHCHGETGLAANAAWPSIAGQKPGYIVNSLKAFRAGLRKDPAMAGVTRGLSDADIANLAAFFSRQSCQPARRTS